LTNREFPPDPEFGPLQPARKSYPQACSLTIVSGIGFFAGKGDGFIFQEKGTDLFFATIWLLSTCFLLPLQIPENKIQPM
jgi:hypothetical protein